MARPSGRKRTWRERLSEDASLEVSAPTPATEKHVRRSGRWSLILGTFIATLVFSAVTLADNLKNDVVAGGNDTFVAGGSTTIDYWIQATGPGGTCDAANGSAATVSINVPANVTATPTPLLFNLCNTSGNEANPNNTQAVTFSSSTPGSYSITASVADAAGEYNTSPANFTLRVTAPAVTDTDGDGVPDSTDNCPNNANADQADADGDGIGNACDSNAYAPAVGINAADGNGNEGATLQTSGSFTDQDGSGTLNITKFSGAGTVTDNGDGTWSWSLPTTDNGSGTVVVQASDGAHTAATDSFDWSAANVPPTIALTGAASVNEGASYSLTLGDLTDPGADTVTSWTVNWGDSSSNTYSSGGEKTHTYADGPASPAITVDLVDEDGTHLAAGTKSITVVNVNPTIGAITATGATAAACLAGNTVGVSFTVSDPASESYDPITGTIDWGDGSTPTSIAGRSINESHGYTAAGSYTITISVNDGDGGTDTETQAVSLLYNRTGFLQPINMDGTSNFKLGSTIPVKIKVTDCSGLSVGTLVPQVSLRRVGSSSGTVNEPVVVESVPDVDNDMRYDASGQQYIYNLSTKRSVFATPSNGPLAFGRYELTVSDPTIAPIVVQFDILK